ncbi:hypothetical protein EDC01DRAFT_608843 [Geopyxis carbonaria]|nr:hypothetical protein EDC01DRAFT_608843 [Geopyxis carbonaria]
MAPIGLAILGSGIFVTIEHLPAVRACSDFELKAVYARSLASVKKLEAGEGVELYSEDSSQGLDALLERDDIQAVIIALPINVQPDIIKRCLIAGKHVLSEKPITKDLKSAQELISWRNANAAKTGSALWAVAENFRYLESFSHARKLLEGLGEVMSFKVQVYSLTDTTGRWYNTKWRQVPDYQGGFVLDGGVHYAAGLSILLGEKDALEKVSAFTAQNLEHLPPVDTMAATCKTKSGKVGFFSVSWGTTDRGWEFSVAAEKGVVRVLPGGKVELKKQGEDKATEELFKNEENGVKQEVKAFAESITKGKLDSKQTPEAAMKDLEIIEKMLTSGDKGGEPQTITG